MENIVFVKRFSQLNAEEKVNKLLQKGWKLLYVGSIDNSPMSDLPGRAIVYVVGATQEQFDNYHKTQNNYF
ncbi:MULTISPECIES: hypothetical protein [Lactobacillus]|uniref:DUF1737 domain-containing protein n=1 Tax=Lactobacillus jensenii TaxID=109790 RepID=A0ABU9FJS2_LACJE|nr:MULTISPECIES: hypothetical protein [Lactobacillus]DAK37293.1 MAG TPA: protein of unknown function (DUF1737) [Caudoviricetes sp.]APT14789.1 hypothetical protein BUE77_04940 [Lactobacillus jensenii]KAA9372014.1 hypothetical protein F6I07_03795 [Lactobacillus jensenii]MCW8082050.1 hypothetical protein [Lactobacillus jensenii]MCW8105922.1 hypothetical protein [Lactobacillus mulieris]